jgi:putative ABC transport system permease protein
MSRPKVSGPGHGSWRDWRRVWGPATVLVGISCGLAAAVVGVMDYRERTLLPFPRPESLVQVQQGVRGGSEGGQLSSGVYSILATRLSTWDIGAYRTQSLTLGSDAGATVVTVAAVTPSMPLLLGIAPSAGRFFTAADAPSAAPTGILGDSPVAVLSHELWVRRFGANPAILDTEIRLDARAFRVIGIAAPHAMYPAEADLWVPLTFGGLASQDHGGYYLRAIARSRAVLAESAKDEWSRIELVLAAASPLNADVEIVTLQLRDYVLGDAARALRLLMVLAVCIIVLVGVNVAGLILGWETLNERAHAIRFALGSTSGDLCRALFAKVGLVWAVAATLSLLVAWITARAARSVLTREGVADDLSVMSGTLVGKLLVLSAIASFVAAAPALWRLSQRAFGRDLLGVGVGVTAGARTRHLLRWLLRTQYVFALCAVAVWLVVAQDFWRTIRAPRGFDATQVDVADVAVSPRLYSSEDGVRSFSQTLLDNLTRAPGSTAAVVLRLPVLDEGGGIWFRYADGDAVNRDTASYDVTFNVVSPGYFSVMNVQVFAGRLFSAADRVGAPSVVIVNRVFAEKFFSGRNPVGRSIVLTPFPDVVRRIVGVVDNVPQGSIGASPTPAIHVPYDQLPVRRFHVVRRLRGSEPELRAIARAVSAVDSRIAVANAMSLERRLRESMSGLRLRLWLVSLLALLGVLVAGAGVYAQLSLATTEREKEFAIRIAAGASSSRILTLLASEMAIDALWGAAAAGALVWLLHRWLPELQSWTSGRLLLAVVIGAAALAASAALGGAAPLWRALRTNPASLLRGRT